MENTLSYIPEWSSKALLWPLQVTSVLWPLQVTSAVPSYPLCSILAQSPKGKEGKVILFAHAHITIHTHTVPKGTLWTTSESMFLLRGQGAGETESRNTWGVELMPSHEKIRLGFV